MGTPVRKLIQEVEISGTTLIIILNRQVDQKQYIGAALTGLTTDIDPLSAEEYIIIKECIGILLPFNEATIEISGEKRVSGSKTIPLLRMIERCVQEKISETTHVVANQLENHLIKFIREKLCVLESSSIKTLPTLLDPRFKHSVSSVYPGQMKLLKG